MVALQMSPAQAATNIVAQLKALRDAAEALAETYAWSSGLTDSDFATATGYVIGDVPAVKSAIADGDSVNSLLTTGQAPHGPAAYQAVSPAYKFINSMIAVIGPQ